MPAVATPAASDRRYEARPGFVTEVARDTARAIERTELAAWLDLYAALPQDFAARIGIAIHGDAQLAWTICPTIPFIHFNCVKNLGMETPATEAIIDDLLARYRVAGIARPWFYANPHARPAELSRWLEARGLVRQGGWERIFRDGAPLPETPLFTSDGVSVERVTSAMAPEWAGFIDRQYGLPTSPWLVALVGRCGWHHYAARRDEKIVAVRSAFFGPDGTAWSGIDAPVPGIMAPSFDLDALLGEAIVRDGLAAGVSMLVADIEAPRADRDGPAYRNYDALGFRLAYFRDHYSFPR